jgi:hypothetical protein
MLGKAKNRIAVMVPQLNSKGEVSKTQKPLPIVNP